MINKINSASTNSPSFKALPINEIKPGVYSINELYHNPEFHGGKRLYQTVRKLLNGDLFVQFTNIPANRANKAETIKATHPKQELTATLKFLDKIV